MPHVRVTIDSRATVVPSQTHVFVCFKLHLMGFNNREQMLQECPDLGTCERVVHFEFGWFARIPGLDPRWLFSRRHCQESRFIVGYVLCEESSKMIGGS